MSIDASGTVEARLERIERMLAPLAPAIADAAVVADLRARRAAVAESIERAAGGKVRRRKRQVQAAG